MLSIFKNNCWDMLDYCYKVCQCLNNIHGCVDYLHNVDHENTDVNIQKLPCIQCFHTQGHIPLNVDVFVFIPGQQSVQWGKVFPAKIIRRVTAGALILAIKLLAKHGVAT